MDFLKKYYVVIILILAACLSAVFFVVKKPAAPKQTVQKEIQIKEDVPTPVRVKQKPMQEAPIMRDENDMPKSDINVPEIG